MKPGLFPRGHLYLAGLLSLGLCSIVVAKFSETTEQRFSTEAMLASVNTQPLPEILAGAEQPAIEALVALPAPEPEAPEPPPRRVVNVEVAPGDSLARIFNKLFSERGTAARELALLLECEPLGPRLRNIYPGHKLTFEFAEDDTLVAMSYEPGPLARFEFERVGTAFDAREVLQEPERIRTYRSGTIENSLFIASQRAGLSDALTMRLAQMFQWDVDFVLDIRKGDEFHVLFEELYLGDRFVGHGEILAAEFVNQGESHLAVLFENNEGMRDYYSPDGNSMRKAFLRAPVEFSRVSSNFNMRRKHPLFKRIMPHRGIDYAAPSGTPILAAGDGRVLTAAKNKNNGRYVVLQHGEQYTTKYLHLSKFAHGVKAGTRVKQGQTIGYVGATGLATAPHLHYEFLVDGVHRNPRTVPLPNASPVDDTQRSEFEAQTQQLLGDLDSHKSTQGTALAYAD